MKAFTIRGHKMHIFTQFGVALLSVMEAKG